MSGGNSIADLIELLGPGAHEAVDAARAELYACFPDPEERRRFILSHFVHVQVIDLGEIASDEAN